MTKQYRKENTGITSHMVELQANILFDKIKQLPEHTAKAVIADHIEMICLMVEEFGYINQHKAWEGISEKLYEEGILVQGD